MSEFNLYLTESKFLKQTHDVILNFVSVCHKMKHWNLMFTHWVVFVFKKKTSIRRALPWMQFLA